MGRPVPYGEHGGTGVSIYRGAGVLLFAGMPATSLRTTASVMAETDGPTVVGEKRVSMSIIALILTAIGAALSVVQDRRCFIAWLISNCYWVWYNWPGIQSCLFVIMSVTCIAGWCTWSKEEENELTRLGDENAELRRRDRISQERIVALVRKLSAATQMWRMN